MKLALFGSVVIGLMYVGIVCAMREWTKGWRAGNRLEVVEPFVELPVKDMKRAAELSRMAYTDGAEGAVAFCDGQPEEDAQAYVWTDRDEEGRMWVAFRGTSSSSDLWADLDVRPVDMVECVARVHSGFYRQFRSVKAQVWRVLENAKGCDEVIFCGHSLAGALASIAALAWASDHPGQKLVKCYTVGSPRAGNGAFRRLVEERVAVCVRLFNENDAVAMLPMSALYTHVGRGVGIRDGGGMFSMKADDPWWLRPIVSLEDADFGGLIADHSCEEYLQRLQNIAESP